MGEADGGVARRGPLHKWWEGVCFVIRTVCDAVTRPCVCVCFLLDFGVTARSMNRRARL